MKLKIFRYKKIDMIHNDVNVENVCKALKEREKKGLKTYGVNTMRTDLSTLEWLQHLQEELMDACVYIEKLKYQKNLDT